MLINPPAQIVQIQSRERAAAECSIVAGSSGNSLAQSLLTLADAHVAVAITTLTLLNKGA